MRCSVRQPVVCKAAALLHEDVFATDEADFLVLPCVHAEQQCLCAAVVESFVA